MHPLDPGGNVMLTLLDPPRLRARLWLAAALLLAGATPVLSAPSETPIAASRFGISIDGVQDGLPPIIGSDSIGMDTELIEVHGPILTSRPISITAMFNPAEFTLNRSVTFQKRPDSTSALWFHALCEGREFEAVTLHFYTADTLTETARARVTNVTVRGWDPVDKEAITGQTARVEEIVLAYEDLILTDLRTGISTTTRADGTCELRMPPTAGDP